MKKPNIYAFARALRQNQTLAESFFWSKVRRKSILGLRFQRQFVIEHSNILGHSSYFIADFCCWQKKLIIEIDGSVHNEQVEYDQMRTHTLEEMGYQVIRFKNENVLNNWIEVEKTLVKKLSI